MFALEVDAYFSYMHALFRPVEFILNVVLFSLVVLHLPSDFFCNSGIIQLGGDCLESWGFSYHPFESVLTCVDMLILVR